MKMCKAYFHTQKINVEHTNVGLECRASLIKKKKKSKQNKHNTFTKFTLCKPQKRVFTL